MHRKIDLQQKKIILLDILTYFHDYCEKNNLTYYLTGGTLLGAVRHNGFIPWDDDIDINMPRKDYECFLDSFNKKCSSSKYKAVSLRDQGYYLTSAKVIDTTTRLREKVNANFDIGVYIDIFPMDNLTSDYSKARELFRDVGRYRNVLTLMNATLRKGRVWYKNVAIQISRIFLAGLSREKVLKKIDKQSRKYENELGSKYIGTPCTAIYGEKEILKSEWFTERCLLKFEGGRFWAPKGYDAFLTQLYGDYMQLPPEEKRVTHHDNKAWLIDD